MMQQAEHCDLLSVIICTYGKRHRVLERCLNSLMKQDYPRREFITIVDGNASHESFEILSKYPVEVYQTKKLGLGGARNFGVDHSQGDFLAFIDDDAVADINWLREIVRGFTDDRIAGVVGRILPIKPDLVMQFFSQRYDKGSNLVEVEELAGGNMCVKRKCLKQVGIFDPNFRYGHEELDLALRLRNAGFKIVYVPSAVVYHDYASNFPKLLKKKFLMGMRRAYLGKKHGTRYFLLGKWHEWIAMLVSILALVAITTSFLGLAWPSLSYVAFSLSVVLIGLFLASVLLAYVKERTIRLAVALVLTKVAGKCGLLIGFIRYFIF